MSHDTNIPEDPERDAQLQNVMAQIKALESKALPVGSVPTPTEPSAGETQQAQAPSAALAPPATPQLAPQLKRTKAKPFALHDVVEVIDQENRYYGVLFKVGDIKDGEIHGYVLKENGAREFVTAKVNEVTRIGECHVRLKTPCSPKWMTQHGG